MNLAAVLVHFGSPEYTAATLTRLESALVVEKIIAVLHDVFPQENRFLRTVFLKSENNGYAAGINRAMRKLEAEFPDISHVLVLNPDVEITSVQIKSLISEHIRGRSDCTFPAIREGKREVHGYSLNFLGLLRPSQNGAKFFPGTCFLTSVTAWRKAGEMNEVFFHYFEDMDFCIRLKKAGLKLHHAANVIIKHAGKSGADYPATELPRYAVRNNLYFLSQSGKLNPITYLAVIAAHFLYLFRWNKGWRGINAWMRGVREYKSL